MSLYNAEKEEQGTGSDRLCIKKKKKRDFKGIFVVVKT